MANARNVVLALLVKLIAIAPLRYRAGTLALSERLSAEPKANSLSNKLVCLAAVLQQSRAPTMRITVSPPPTEEMADVAVMDVPMAEHHEVVEAHHRFSGVTYKGVPWDLSHLDAFALRVDPDLGYTVDVVVLFSCHCFTRSYKRDGRPMHAVPVDERFENGRESRVLCSARYELSRQFLPQLIKELSHRTIQFAGADPLNFVTLEEFDTSGKVVRRYAVFFEVTRDNKRRKRLLLHVQSAYELTELTQRQSKAGKVKFLTLLKAAYERRKLKG